MDGRAADLDSDGRVQSTHSGLEGLETEVLVGEQTVLATVHAKGDSDGDVVLIGAEPGVALCLLEDVMEERVVTVVIHGLQSSRARADDHGAKTAPGMRARGREWKKETRLGTGGKEDALETGVGVKRARTTVEERRADKREALTDRLQILEESNRPRRPSHEIQYATTDYCSLIVFADDRVHTFCEDFVAFLAITAHQVRASSSISHHGPRLPQAYGNQEPCNMHHYILGYIPFGS